MHWMVVIPPLLAIAVAIWRKEVLIALLVALITSETIIAGWNPAAGFTGLLDRLVQVFQSEGNTRVLLFSLIVGALIEFIQSSGGVGAVINRLSRLGLTKTPRQVSLLTTFTGLFIFIETNLSILTAGILSRGLFDRFNMSRERLAYIIDSTCAPVAVLILLNGWGAYLLGLISNYQVDQPVYTLAMTIPLNFYALLTVAMVFYTAITGKVYGPMKTVESFEGDSEVEEPVPPTKARYMLIPLAVMIFGIVFFLWWTGNGNIMQGSGSESVLWATVLAVVVAYLLLAFEKVFSHQELVDRSFKGMSNLLPLVTIVLLSLALGASLQALGTGEFIASMIGQFLPPVLIAPLIFVAAGAVSFTTGTSWGTFALMIPIGMPLVFSMGLSAPLVLAAVIGGGIFGDHCSPISDTTIISSLAAGCHHIDHVKTQLPYALATGGVTVVLYFLAGFIL